jgi:hypothetical protein
MTDDGGTPFDLDDDDEFLAAWDEADREAASVLREACPEVLGEPAPADEFERAARELREGLTAKQPAFRYFLSACGWQAAMPDDPEVLWVDAAASTVSPVNDPGTDADEQASVFSLEHADWVGMVTGLVRRGVGAPFDAESAERYIEECPEVEGEPADEGETAVLASAVAVLVPLWQVLGILDEGEQLTALGRWGLPRAVLAAWEHHER